jgi:hypothetical protein
MGRTIIIITKKKELNNVKVISSYRKFYKRFQTLLIGMTQEEENNNNKKINK